MNRHNFLQFNPNSYKKHLSPCGQNVLDTLIRYWRTGFDNNGSRNRHQIITNQNRKNTREFDNNCHSIPSIPPSPIGDANYEREISPTNNHFTAGDHLAPITAVRQVSDPPTFTYETKYDNYIDPVTNFNNDGFAKPRILVGQRPAPAMSVGKTYQEKEICGAKQKIYHNFELQYQGVQNCHKQNFNGALPVDKQIIKDDSYCGVANAIVPASCELVEMANTNEEEILTANDMITPVINFDKANENLLSSGKHIDQTQTDNSIMLPPMKFLEILNVNAKNKTVLTRDEVIKNKEAGVMKDVGWDDMFDTELFLEVKAPQMLVTPFQNDRSNFKLEFHKDTKKKPGKTNTDNKVNKRKNQMKVTDIIPRKVKKATHDSGDTSKKNFSKVKCATAVKNWLNDVDPNNVVDDDNGECGVSALLQSSVMNETNVENITSGHNINTITKNKTVSKDIMKKIEKENTTKLIEINTLVEKIELAKKISNVLDETVKSSSKNEIKKKPKAKIKKVVQARLAQKDGKMKYGPPAKGQNEKTELTEDNETKSKEAAKENKVKLKFIAPIKSQIPVKNITFDVNTIDESNLHLLHDVIECQENEIVMILIYSNGFCQLNNHHTEETCVPEGILIQSGDAYYYSKDVENNDLIRQLLENFNVICYSGKQLVIHLSSKYGLELKQDTFHLFDAKIGAALIDPDNPPENFADVQKLLGFTPEFTIATECVLQKAAWYITLLRECFGKLKSSLIENSVWNVFVEIEMRLLPIIAGMEYRGVRVDVEKLKSMENILLTKMKAVEQECYKAAGKAFQINSTVQVRTILYDELQLDTKTNLKIKETISKGAKSTSETMLRGLMSAHPLPRLILEYRHLHKAHATFLTGIAQHVKDGTVKPTWVQTAAATGRIASNNPNLQAIPKAPFSLVMFPENSEDQDPVLSFRSVYTCRPQHWLVGADFKHIECRVFAHAAADATLLDALRTGHDLFKVLAAKWLNKPVDEVCAEDRERTKRIVYASLYGAGARKLMEILHIGYEQALGIISSFHRTFPALRTFGRAVAARAAAGALRSLCGRARRFPHIASAHSGLRAHAERQAVNFVVQGSAADLCKRAMVEVQRRFERAPPVRGRLALQIHDELVWEVAAHHVDRAAAIIKEVMEGVGRLCGMDMLLPVELTAGRSWGDMRPTGPDSGGDMRPTGPDSGGDTRPTGPDSGGDMRPTGPDSGGDTRPTGPDSGGDTRPTGPDSGGDMRPTGPDSGGDTRPTGPDSGGDKRPTGPDSGGDTRPTGPDSGGDTRPTGPDSGGDTRPTGPDSGGDMRPTGPDSGGDTRPTGPSTGATCGPRDRRAPAPNTASDGGIGIL